MANDEATKFFQVMLGAESSVAAGTTPPQDPGRATATPPVGSSGLAGTNPTISCPPDPIVGTNPGTPRPGRFPFFQLGILGVGIFTIGMSAWLCARLAPSQPPAPVVVIRPANPTKSGTTSGKSGTGVSCKKALPDEDNAQAEEHRAAEAVNKNSRSRPNLEWLRAAAQNAHDRRTAEMADKLLKELK